MFENSYEDYMKKILGYGNTYKCLESYYPEIYYLIRKKVENSKVDKKLGERIDNLTNEIYFEILENNGINLEGKIEEEKIKENQTLYDLIKIIIINEIVKENSTINQKTGYDIYE